MNTLLLTITLVSVAMAAAATWLAFRFWREDRLRSEVRVALLAELSRPAASGGTPAPGELFRAESVSPAWPRRLAIASGLFAAVALGVFAYDAMPAAPPAAQGVAPAPRPLELITLGHTRESGLLVVSGLVQNPRDGGTRTRVAVAATLLDAGGAIIGDGRSPLDVARLEPGDESPFAIRIPAPADVARYRVSFRAADDSPLAHVDRRDPTLARKEAP